MMNRPSVPGTYFAEMYRGRADPWHLAERWYEQRKYALTMASLPVRRYRRAFEPGCSVGVLSALLAERCDRLLSWDRRPEAVAVAAKRLASFDGAEAVHGVVPEQWPDGEFDLIVFSELLYYFDAEDRAWLLSEAVRSLAEGGHVVAVHWRHHVPEHAADAETVHADVRAQPGLTPLARHEEDDFLLDVMGRHETSTDAGTNGAALSVAALEGLV
ncbi:methyltransferase domain-containing protein [Actinospica sp. MGRD01-02]|uniref:Methyltransferase domain-containing protein n=1 Tax=Actinospica acidithermotolerans TaxID=2828514 RepID=A0A941EK68_9ACTN|nr:SAM-dependent methyltransferase [Actinospica acidithermotolerans]MBR7829114.1 methyltransferase domain-containing protein [Actinospica acidithermotolerans]